MKYAYDVLRRPIITERSMEGVSDSRYVFEVAPTANKIEIKKAVETIFDVKVAKIHTIKLPGKKKRMGVHVGKTPATKKAIVILKEGSKPIEIFDGMM